MNKNSIVKSMIRFVRKGGYDKPDIDNKWFTEDKAANRLIVKDPFAYLLAVIYDQGMTAERVWAIPYELKRRLGYLSAIKLAKISDKEIIEVFHQESTLHRFPKTMAIRTKKASELVVKKYRGKAENIWNDKPSSFELHRRFEDFNGIGQKKASMAVNILMRDYGIELADKRGIDVSYDIHIRRVFLRSGLASRDNLSDIIMSARELNPEYPGILDLPSWLIGRNHCKPENPDCGNCPINTECGKFIHIKVSN